MNNCGVACGDGFHFFTLLRCPSEHSVGNSALIFRKTISKRRRCIVYTASRSQRSIAKLENLSCE